MPPTTVLIVEDHPLFSRGLASLIASRPQYTVIGEAKNAAEALELARTQKPDLAIVDLKLGGDDGLVIIKKLKTLAPKTITLVLSMFDERYYAERALNAGARGYIMKAEAGNKVLEAITTVMSGKIYVSEAEKERFMEFMAGGGSKDDESRFASLGKLSDRQLQIFGFLGKGLGTVEIAAKLHLSTKTIDTHKEHIKLKLHCNNTQELRQLAIEWANSAG